MSYKDINLLLTHQSLSLTEEDDAGEVMSKGGGVGGGGGGRRKPRRKEETEEGAGGGDAPREESPGPRGDISELRGGEDGGEHEGDALLEGCEREEDDEVPSSDEDSHHEAMKHLSLAGGRRDYYDDDEEEDMIDTTMMYPSDSMDNVAITGGRRKASTMIPQVMAALSVSLGSMIVGFSTAYSSPALASMTKEGSNMMVTKQEQSWIGGIMPLAALLGGIIGGPLIEALGRRNTIIATGLPFVISWLLIAMATDVGMVLGGRSVAGFCVGIASLSLPVYLGETIQPEVRGTLGLLPTALGNIGILVCFVVGTYLDWSQLAMFGAALPVPFVICMLLIPETPRWYISKNRPKDARNALQWLRGKDTDVSAEFEEMESTNAENKKVVLEPEGGNSRCSSVSVSSLFDLFSPSNSRPLIISVGLMFFQQMSGINAVIFYTVSIFREAGTSLDENLCTIVVGVVNFMSTFVATTLIDRLGRKVLLNVSGVAMIISLVALGAFFYAKSLAAIPTEALIDWNTTFAASNLTEDFMNMTQAELMANLTAINATLFKESDLALSIASWSWLPLLAFVVYVVGFSLGFGPIPWLMMGEVLPAKIRGSAASLATAFNWTCTFIVTKTFEDLIQLIGTAGVFWLFGSIVTIGLVFVFFIVPETQGRSLEDIEMILTGRKKEVHVPPGYDKRVPVRRMSSIANLKPSPMGV
ncbi:facilitated trehalose transporter Tret1-like isoform X2 [Ischnura elegans]|uniref:facilitated trehalose transporter Tret1-like isoform X2 n=1 Tax=Ischnura elegans TaxID=197161 RepID=UPI001ED883F5|nr:facilitated trehalose transporter Tret1-like isoform X2 [Ischnura elegans]